VREWPPSGGTSACAESLPEAPALAEAGRALLDALRWHGVAMVEFKGTLEPPAGNASAAGGTPDARSPSGAPPASTSPASGRPAPGLALIEINAKFWGSHDLALAAGVDFPGDMAALLEGRGLGPAPDRGKAVRFAWPFGGDLWHGIFHPASLPAVLGDALSTRVAHNWRLDDPVPLLFEIAQWLRSTPGAWREHRAAR
jgi:hypothetical protein